MNGIEPGRWGLVLLCGLLATTLGGCATGTQWARVSDQQDFQHRISSAAQPVLVEFYRTECPHCWGVAPVLNSLSDDYQGRVTFLAVEYSQGGALFGQYGIRGTPTVLLFVGGVERGRWVGEGSKNVYSRALDSALGGQRRGP
jgi:thioredoxin-like negative regulator of GroEL